ncbi:unnamed protein product [Nyctereutes procyonoides]|uniref:(raccoon dog) hypothetical protein n=1 Tax=Nyctereutes procyonoides TaxID=34880 RepID=A0A811YNT0_NYCPR|nr:unnamed protein product [Nyctereutes procyonoides]
MGWVQLFRTAGPGAPWQQVVEAGRRAGWWEGRTRRTPKARSERRSHVDGESARRSPARGGIGFSPGNFPHGPGSQREEAAAWPGPDGGDGGAQMLQALGQLAVFLLWCHQKKWARQDRGAQRENPRVPLRTQGMGRPPEAWRSHAVDAPRAALPDTQPRRAWLGRCFGAWQRFAQRGAGFRERLAHRQAHTLRLCLQQWLRMRRLRASDGAKVTQLSLCQQKAGSATLCGAAPGVAAAHGLGVVAQVQVPAQEQGRGSLQEACQRLALQRALLLWRTRLSQRRRPDISDRALRQLQHILSRGHLTARGLSASAPELLGSLPGGEPRLGGRPPRSSPQRALRAPAPLETLGLSFRWASGQRRKGRCLRLWQVRARQSRGAARWCRRALQRRVLVGWSRWASAQGAQRQLAVGWARGRCGRAALRWWRRRLAQRLEVEQRVRARGRALARGALQRWRTCWQRQQFLHAKYQRWVQVHRQGLRRSVFQRWRRAAARRRRPGALPEQLLLHSHSPAWRAVVRDAGALPATGAFQGGPGEARGAAWAVWQGARAAEAWARERRVAWASVGRWRKRVQEHRADRQLRRARAQQAFAVWRAALGQRCRVHQVEEERAALSWAPRAQGSRLHRGSRAQAAWKLSTRALGAWAQAAAKGRVQRAAVTQFPQAGSRRLLWTHRALCLEPQAETQEALAGDPGIANKGTEPRAGLDPATLMPPPDPKWRAGGTRNRPSHPGALHCGDQPPARRALRGGRPAAPRAASSSQVRAPGRLGDAAERRLGASPHQEEIRAALAPRGVASPAPGLGAGQAPGSDMAALGRCSGRGAAGTDAAEAVAPEVGLACVAAAGPAAAGGSAITAPRMWLGPFPGSEGGPSIFRGRGQAHYRKHRLDPDLAGDHVLSPVLPGHLVWEGGLATAWLPLTLAHGYKSLSAPSLICPTLGIASQVRICSEPVHLAWGRAGWLAGVDGGVSSSLWAQEELGTGVGLANTVGPGGSQIAFPSSSLIPGL